MRINRGTLMEDASPETHRKITFQKRPRFSVDIIIPAFNEGSCIQYVLDDVKAAWHDERFYIQNIYVVSDASTDQTDDIVKSFSKIDPRFKLISKAERQGKQDSINYAFLLSSADIVVFIDADVKLANHNSLANLLHPFLDGETALVQGGLVRAHSRLSLHPAKLAAYFDWILVDNVRKRKAMSWWSIDGRVMALSRDFYQHLQLPLSLADDQYIFYSCIQQSRKFVLADDAVFYYGPPESIADFSHQWSRYFFYTKQSRQYFGEELIDRNMSFPGLWRTIMACFLHHPLYGLMWVLCYTISKVEFMLRVDFRKYERGFFWTKSSPLKSNKQ